MTDQPRRRGRPPRVATSGAVTEPDMPRLLPDLRIKAGQLQRAVRHPDGLEWRPVVVVPETAHDWEPTDAASPPAR